MSNNFTKDLEGWERIIKQQAKDIKAVGDEFNEKHPPHKEVTVLDSDTLESCAAGIWFSEDGQVTFSYKLPNGLYDPWKLIHVPKEIANVIRRS
jgi:hypothetical protein